MTVVICSWRMRALLLRCLETVGQERERDWQVVVVVNSDEDGTAGAVRARFPWVELIVNPVNRGVAAARNQGMGEAQGRVIILLDADTTVPLGSLRGLAGALLRDPKVGVIGPRLVSPRGEPQATARQFPTMLSKLRRRSPPLLARLLPSDAIELGNEPRRVGYVIGACQAIRTRALHQVGFLDERIFYGPEDVDFCLRMWKEGWQVVWDPRFTIVHHEQRATRRRVLSRLMLRHLHGLAYFFFKHRYLLHLPTFLTQIADADAEAGAVA